MKRNASQKTGKNEKKKNNEKIKKWKNLKNQRNKKKRLPRGTYRDGTKNFNLPKKKVTRNREAIVFAVFLLCPARLFVLDTCDGLCAHG